MKAFNSRKLPKEHRLFLKKGKKLSFTICEKYEDSEGVVRNFIENGIIKIYKKDGLTFALGGTFKVRKFYNQYNKLVKSNGKNFRIKHFEERLGTKIENLGLKRSDFSEKRYRKNINKIYKAITEYREGVKNGK